MGYGALEEASSLKIRAFFGLPVAEVQRDEVKGFIQACAAAAPAFRWADANLHLTVRFIGSVDRAVVEAIADRLQSSGGRSFELGLGDLGSFRRGALVRVVWLAVAAGSDELIALAARIESECVAAGLEPEPRPFKPHVTLARARSRDGAALPELPLPPVILPWRVGGLVLYSSHLGRSGAVHEPIREILLPDAT